MTCALYVYIVYSEVSNNGVASFNRLAASSRHTVVGPRGEPRLQDPLKTRCFNPSGSEDFRDH